MCALASSASASSQAPPTERLVDFVTTVGLGSKFFSKFSAMEAEIAENLLEQSYSPELLTRAPTTDTKERQLPENVELFTFPDSIRFEERRLTSRYHTFTLTDVAGNRKYGFCLVRYFRMRSSFISRVNRAVGERKYKKLFLPSAVCIISRFPFFMKFGKYFSVFQSLQSSRFKFGARVTEKIFEELCIPFPVQNGAVVDMGTTLIPFSNLSTKDHLPLSDVDFKVLVCTLSPSNILMALYCLLSEQQLLFISENSYALSQCTESLMSLMHPFVWNFVYIPVLPRILREYLIAPFPYVMGTLRGFLEEVEIHEMAIVIDLDSNAIFCPKSLSLESPGCITPLPWRFHKRVLEKLERFQSISPPPPSMDVQCPELNMQNYQLLLYDNEGHSGSSSALGGVNQQNSDLFVFDDPSRRCFRSFSELLEDDSGCSTSESESSGEEDHDFEVDFGTKDPNYHSFVQRKRPPPHEPGPSSGWPAMASSLPPPLLDGAPLGVHPVSWAPGNGVHFSDRVTASEGEGEDFQQRLQRRHPMNTSELSLDCLTPNLEDDQMGSWHETSTRISAWNAEKGVPPPLDLRERAAALAAANSHAHGSVDLQPRSGSSGPRRKLHPGERGPPKQSPKSVAASAARKLQQEVEEIVSLPYDPTSGVSDSQDIQNTNSESMPPTPYPSTANMSVLALENPLQDIPEGEILNTTDLAPLTPSDIDSLRAPPTPPPSEVDAPSQYVRGMSDLERQLARRKQSSQTGVRNLPGNPHPSLCSDVSTSLLSQHSTGQLLQEAEQKLLHPPMDGSHSPPSPLAPHAAAMLQNGNPLGIGLGTVDMSRLRSVSPDTSSASELTTCPGPVYAPPPSDASQVPSANHTSVSSSALETSEALTEYMNTEQDISPVSRAYHRQHTANALLHLQVCKGLGPISASLESSTSTPNPNAPMRNRSPGGRPQDYAPSMDETSAVNQSGIPGRSALPSQNPSFTLSVQQAIPPERKSLPNIDIPLPLEEEPKSSHSPTAGSNNPLVSSSMSSRSNSFMVSMSRASGSSFPPVGPSTPSLQSQFYSSSSKSLETVRKSFLNVWVSIFKLYRQYLIFPTAEDPDPQDIFRHAAFIEESSVDIQSFLERFCSTQAFQFFTQSRLDLSEPDLFDELVREKLTRLSISLNIRSTSSFSGVLIKQGSFVKSWKRRFFILKGTTLSYFVDKSARRKKGSFEIVPGQSRIIAPRESIPAQPTPYLFSIITPTKRLNCCAETPHIRKGWMHQLRAKAMDVAQRENLVKLYRPERSNNFTELIQRARNEQTRHFQNFIQWVALHKTPQTPSTPFSPSSLPSSGGVLDARENEKFDSDDESISDDGEVMGHDVNHAQFSDEEVDGEGIVDEEVPLV